MNIQPLLYTLDSIRTASEKWRNDGLTVVFTNGCFDLIHPGHVRYLHDARQLGDLLVLGINTDASVARLKGPTRPIMNLEERSEILLAFRWVDAVVPFDDPTPLTLIEAVKPNVLVKGGDWPVEKIVGRELVEQTGGKVLSLPFHEGASTTGIVERIRSAD
jgi:D-beta-D-heptose 7-phosphate kinase/D-beta-D-heptose 1-phosphate adenosyltransferase